MKYLKLSGSLYLVGVQGGVTRFQPFSEYHDARKTGHNTELFGLTGGNPWVKETVEEIMEMLTLDLPVVAAGPPKVFIPFGDDELPF